MSKLTALLTFLTLLNCQHKRDNQAEVIQTEIQSKIVEVIEPVDDVKMDSSKLKLNFKPRGNYASILQQVSIDKAYFKNLYQSNPNKALDTVSEYMYSKLLNDIVPHWYGTEWDFNGYTNTPKNGEIACGYFVSTTLKHFGFNLNRFKMAQAAGLDEAKLLQPRNAIKVFSNLTFEELNQKLNSHYKDGLYFVGLDNHVGYVLLKDKVPYFLHSSYCVDQVIIELAETSPCFNSNIYVFAEITTNASLLKKWILNERLNI